MKNKIMGTLVLGSVLLSGCATIVGDKTQLIPISSTPSDALVVITDETGSDIYKGQTPTTVTLPKSDGSYWGKKSFSVEITKEGYETQVVPITANANGWYIAGNFVFGGLIGWFVIDPLSGAMYTLSPEQISSTLPGEKAAHNNKADDGSISIVLLQDVPTNLINEMKQIN